MSYVASFNSDFKVSLHDLRGAFTLFAETSIGSQYLLPSAVCQTNLLDEDDKIIAQLQPNVVTRVTTRRDRINGQTSRARQCTLETGRFCLGWRSGSGV